MATFKKKVESFNDQHKLLKWAEALDIHEDPIILQRLQCLQSEGNETDSNSEYLPPKESNLKDFQSASLPPKESNQEDKDSRCEYLPPKESNIKDEDSRSEYLPPKESNVKDKDSSSEYLPRKQSNVTDEDSRSEYLPPKESNVKGFNEFKDGTPNVDREEKIKGIMHKKQSNTNTDSSSEYLPRKESNVTDKDSQSEYLPPKESNVKDGATKVEEEKETKERMHAKQRMEDPSEESSLGRKQMKGSNDERATQLQHGDYVGSVIEKEGKSERKRNIGSETLTKKFQLPVDGELRKLWRKIGHVEDSSQENSLGRKENKSEHVLQRMANTL